MGTRGMFGVVVDGTVKASYNHFDSYPDGLGADIVEQVKFMLNDWGQDKMVEQARRLTMVNEDAKPTPEQIAELAGFSNQGVSTGDLEDWYVLLRELQGNLTDTLVVGLMIEGGDQFALDSLFCEWGYLVNLDDGVLEVYKGFNKVPPKGRFASGEVDGEYYPITLVNEFPLDELPDDFAAIVEFCSNGLFITEDGKEWTDGNAAAASLKNGGSCVAYSVYDGERDPITTLLRHKEQGYFTFVPFEDI